eukprot:1281734-Prorocentrum_lima.AAC.1
MTSSLVGSEMCIRDRRWREQWQFWGSAIPSPSQECGVELGIRKWIETVSYTHLTLPTICSV